MCSVKRIGKVCFHWSQGFPSLPFSGQKMTLMIHHRHFPVNSFRSIQCFKADSWCSTGFHLLERWRWITKYPTRIPEAQFQRRAVIFHCSLWCEINLVRGFVWIFKQLGFHKVHSLTLILQHLLTSESGMSLFPHRFVLFRSTQTFGKAGQDLQGREGL